MDNVTRPVTSSSSPYDYILEPMTASDKKKMVSQQLREVGLKTKGLVGPELRELPKILHDYERIMGILYGYNDDGFAVILATDKRVIYLDKKPFFLKIDEITYDLVGGVTYEKVGLLGTVTLHSRLGDYKLRTMNFRTAEIFVHYIEQRCLEHGANSRTNYGNPALSWRM